MTTLIHFNFRGCQSNLSAIFIFARMDGVVYVSMNVIKRPSDLPALCTVKVVVRSHHDDVEDIVKSFTMRIHDTQRICLTGNHLMRADLIDRSDSAYVKSDKSIDIKVVVTLFDPIAPLDEEESDGIGSENDEE